MDWRPTAGGNVEVLNDTADFYRFFDATAHAEFLYRCVRKTIERNLPDEVDFLRRHDAFRTGLQRIIDMPDRLSDLLFRFLRQYGGNLSHRARTREFAALTAAEIVRVETLYREAFHDQEDQEGVCHASTSAHL